MDQARYEEVIAEFVAGKMLSSGHPFIKAYEAGYLDRDGAEYTACLDGDFTADQLEAIARWMRENGDKA